MINIQIANAKVRPLYAFNKKHLQITEIALLQTAQLPDQTIMSFKNALVTSTNHLFVKGKYIQTGLIAGSDLRTLTYFQRIYLFIKSRFCIANEIHKIFALWAHDSWSNNYYHWFNETLPQLFLLNQYIENSIVILPLELSNKSFIVDSLELLKIHYKWIDQKKTNRFDSLAVLHTSTLRPDINPFLQKQVRYAIFSALNIVAALKPFRKIYISRKNARYRKIINEEELLPLLKEYGYEIIYPERNSFIEQVILFSESKALISVHGAGHTNCMFMNKESKVMEIRNAEWDSQPLCFWELANIFELKWEYVTAQSVDKASNFNDIYIPLHSFKESVLAFETL